jgi:hypothetical protein
LVAKFDEPITLSDGRKLVSLRDAATYATKFPKKEADTAEWQAAIEALMLVATRGGPTMLARIGVMRAFDRHVDRTFDTSGKKPHSGRTRAPRGAWDKLARDR